MTTDLRSATGARTPIVAHLAAPLPVRAAFRVLERTAPRLGGRWAEHIWFTLPPPRPDTRSAAAVPYPGRPFSMRAGGRTVAGESWGDGPAVYLLHGWAGHRGQLGAFVAPLVARGLRVIAFDAPSHGGSPPGAYGPRSSSVPEFAAALAAVVADQGPAHAVVGHSAGATATALALCDGLRAGRLVMLAPMASPAAYIRQFAALLGAGGRIHRQLVARVERRVGPLRHMEVPQLGRAVRMPPTLVVHDRDDASVSVTDGAAIAAAWPAARLRVTAGLGHRRLLRDPGVVDEVVEFVSG
jgi:pimeloyl-ACP methyl ester carboxylesterase